MFVGPMYMEKLMFITVLFSAWTSAQDITPEPVATTSHTELALSTNVTALKILPKFSNFSNIHSDPLQVLNNSTILIPNFQSNESKVVFTLKRNSDEKLYTNQVTTTSAADISLKLPDGCDISDIRWIAAASASGENLGRVVLSKTYSKQVFGFGGPYVTSGPIVLINTTSIYVPNLRYKGDQDDARFCVGKDEYYVLIPDEKSSSEILTPYAGENIEIRLPIGNSINEIEFIGVCHEKTNETFVSTNVTGLDVPQASDAYPGATIIRLPKCCLLGQSINAKECINMTRKNVEYNITFHVHEHNMTHFDDTPLRNVQFEPYYSPLLCVITYLTEGDKHGILKNGSLMTNSLIRSGMLSQDEFCTESLESNPDNILVFLCIPDEDLVTNKAMFGVYIAFTVISAVCFFGAFLLYFVIVWKCDDIHKKCFAAYAFSMFCNFLFLIVIQMGNVEGTGCEVLGFLFQITMISSFMWLGILCFDVLYIIIYFDDNTKKGRRFLWYACTAAGVSFLSLIISLSRNLTPDVPTSFFKPQYAQNTCVFDGQEQRSMFFYIPIGLAIVSSLGFLVYSKLRIVKYDTDNKNNYFWINSQRNIKFMFRQCLIIFVLMVISWISNILMTFVDDASGLANAAVVLESLQGFRRYLILTVMMAIWMVECIVRTKFSAAVSSAVDLFEAFQGIIVVLLFVANKETKRALSNKGPPIGHNGKRPSMESVLDEEFANLNTDSK